MKKILVLLVLKILFITNSVIAQTDTLFVWFYKISNDYQIQIDTFKYSNKVKEIKYYLVSTKILKSKIKNFKSQTQLKQDLQDEVPFEHYVFLEQVNPLNPRGAWTESFEKVNLLKTRMILSIEEFEQNQFYKEFNNPIYLVIPDSSTNIVKFIKVTNYVY